MSELTFAVPLHSVPAVPYSLGSKMSPLCWTPEMAFSLHLTGLVSSIGTAVVIAKKRFRS
jgi:hypothetical protein